MIAALRRRPNAIPGTLGCTFTMGEIREAPELSTEEVRMRTVDVRVRISWRLRATLWLIGRVGALFAWTLSLLPEGMQPTIRIGPDEGQR